MCLLTYSARVAISRTLVTSLRWQRVSLVPVSRIQLCRTFGTQGRQHPVLRLWANDELTEKDVASTDPLDHATMAAEVQQRSEFLANMTGLPASKFKPFVKKLDVLRKAPENHLSTVYNMLVASNIDPEDILEEPRILITHPLLIDNYSQCLLELGHKDPAVKWIKVYPYLARKRISRLRADGVVLPGDLIKRLLRVFRDEDLPTLEQEIRKSVPDNFMTEWTLQDLWCRFQAAYLHVKYDFDVARSINLLTIVPRTRNKSLRHFKENLRILTELFQIPRTRLFAHSYLLTAHPSNMMKIWTEVSTIAGLPAYEVIAKLPKLLMSPASNLLEIDDILLNKYKFPPETVQRMLDVYTLSPATVLDRLSEMDKVPYFQALKYHPRVLRLVVYQNKAKLRLEQLQSLNMQSSASLDLLSTSTEKFEKLLDRNGKNRGRDLIFLLATALHVDADIVKEELHKHPFWCNVPLVDVKATLTLLLVKGYKEEQILNALQLLLYPEDLVAEYVDKLPHKPELQPFEEFWRNHPRVLHLALYYIEKTSNFTGTAVFRDAVAEEHVDDVDEHLSLPLI